MLPSLRIPQAEGLGGVVTIFLVVEEEDVDSLSLFLQGRRCLFKVPGNPPLFSAEVQRIGATHKRAFQRLRFRGSRTGEEVRDSTPKRRASLV